MGLLLLSYTVLYSIACFWWCCCWNGDGYGNVAILWIVSYVIL